MNRLLIILILTMASAPLYGNPLSAWKFQTPEPVVHALDSLYPGDKDVRWSRKGKRYTADFVYQGITISSTFDKEGTMLSCQEEISFERLPLPVQEKIARFYNSYKVVMVLQRKSHDKVEYDVEVIQGKRHYILNYHPRGFLIHQYEVYKFDWASEFSD